MADKKITELPFITDVTASVGSSPSNTTVIPVVLYGTTNQITADNLKDNFIRNVRSTVKDIQTYTSSLKGAVTVRGNGIEVAGNLEVQGNMSVKGTIFTQYETSSVVYSSGSTKFGNSFDDLHETTGSVFFTGSHNINGENYTYYSSSNSAVFTNFSSSNSTAITAFSSSNSTLFTTYSSSNSTLFTNFSSSNSSYNTTFSSSNEIYVTALSSSNSTTFTNYSSSNSTTFTNYSSSNSTTFTNYSSSTANTINGLSSGVSSELARVYQATASIQAQTSSLLAFTASQVDRNTNLSIVTGSLNNFTASQDSRNYTISQYTSSTDAHIVGISAFTSSILAVNLGNSIYTASVDSHIVGISTYTSSVRDTLARVHQATQSLELLSGSLIGITNGLMAFTAALDNTYATDAQLYQLYQATRSLELHSGSMIGVTNGLMAYTASNTTLNTGLRGEVDGIEAYTASLKGQAIVSSSTQVQNYDVFALNSNLYISTGSLIGITNGLMAFTAALDSTYATDAQLYQLYQATRSIELTTGSLIGITNGLMAFTAALDSTYATDAQLYQLYAETASIKAEIAGIEAYTASLKGQAIVSSSTQIQNYDLFALNSNLYNGTGSIKGEIAGIEAYTASLKSAAIVSSSQQITNYYKFAETASANTFYGNQSITGSVAMTGSLRVGDWVGGSPHVDETARFDVRTSVDRGIKITGNVSSDVIITAYRGASDDLVRTMRLQGNAVNFYIGDGNANTGSYVGGFTTNGLAFENGKGIDFSATSNGSGTMTSELLNDYEEGTWTPTIQFGGASAGVTYSTAQPSFNKGYYTKVGRQVTAIGYLILTNKGSSTGDANIAGLPFTNLSNTYSAVSFAEWANISFADTFHGYTSSGGTVIILEETTNAGVITRLTDANFANDSGVIFTVTYFV